jgi:hypothetical protein
MEPGQQFLLLNKNHTNEYANVIGKWLQRPNKLECDSWIKRYGWRRRKIEKQEAEEENVKRRSSKWRKRIKRGGGGGENDLYTLP